MSAAVCIPSGRLRTNEYTWKPHPEDTYFHKKPTYSIKKVFHIVMASQTEMYRINLSKEILINKINLDFQRRTIKHHKLHIVSRDQGILVGADRRRTRHNHAQGALKWSSVVS